MRYTPFAAVIIVLFALAGSLAADGESEQIVLARVNEEVITLHDVDILLVLSGKLDKAEAQYHGDELGKARVEAFNETLADLINESVFLVNAKLDGVNFEGIDRKQAEHILEKNIEPFVTQANYEYRLKQRGLTIEDVKERTRRSIICEKYRRQKLAIDTFITPAQAREYYEKNKTQFTRRVTVAHRQIEISFGAGKRTKSAARQLINNIKKSLDEGSGFGMLAKQFSEGPYSEKGGLWPHKAEEDLITEIADEVEKLEKGGVSGVIEREGAFLLVKLEERDRSPYEPFEKALDKIVMELDRRKQEKKAPEFKKKMYSRVQIELLYEGAGLEELCPASSHAGGEDENNSDQAAP